MSLNSYKDEVKSFLEKADFLNQETALKMEWLEEEFRLLKEAIGANKPEWIRHQIYDMIFLLFEIAVDYDFDLDDEWNAGKKKKQEKYLGGQPFELRQSRYNAETVAAIQEANDIMAGRIKTKTYANPDEFNADLDSEDDDEV